jgi:hypothetical protein
MKMIDILWQAFADAHMKGAQGVHDDHAKLIDWKAEAAPIAAECRNQVIQELMEKAGNAAVYSRNPYGDMELEWDYNVADWLQSQMEGGE